ncbi:MAG TPA: hypothetical protein VOA64_02850 [Candidatus Dormibacteraeota bacterium]|nr:hypothetical protein [Candidatus Dormibacteraeota bacterium]
MELNAKPRPGGLGFRVKSGWAMAVLLTGNSSSPRLLRCLPILLSDPQVPGSKQPYHAALELPEKEGRNEVQRLRNVVGRAAERSVAELLKQANEADCRVRVAALVVGSLVDPGSLHNEHIRAHALEGQLFRTVLEDALRGHKIGCAVVLEKNAYAETAALLRTSTGRAKRIAADLGDGHKGSWRAEEKLAALAAWLALTSS